MAPLPTENISQLAKRYYTSYYGSNSTYRPWWVVFAVVIPVLILLVLCWGFRKRNFKRRAQGAQPVPYTGWTTYQWNGNNNNQQQQQQPYYKPEGVQYDYDQQPGATGQYNQDGYNQPPNYYQTNGDNNPSADMNNTQYQRPDGPPPGHNSGPSFPQNAYTKS